MPRDIALCTNRQGYTASAPIQRARTPIVPKIVSGVAVGDTGCRFVNRIPREMSILCSDVLR